jgi:hypothetical protein
MASSGILRQIALVRTDVSDELDDGGAKFLRNVGSYKIHTANIPENAILHSHHRENLKSYIALTGWTL